jgi:hypothetical protein
MPPRSKSGLAHEHLTRASAAFEAGDPVVGVTFLHLAAEAAIVALSELHGITTERQHWRKAEAATELHTRGILSVDLSQILELLNQARKDAAYEGEDPDLGDWTSEDLLNTVEDAVQTAEEAAKTLENDTDAATVEATEDETQTAEDAAGTDEESSQ